MINLTGKETLQILGNVGPIPSGQTLQCTTQDIANLAYGNSPTITGYSIYQEYLLANNLTRGSDEISTLQSWLNYCYLQSLAIENNSEALDDQNQRNAIVAILPRGNYQVSCPLVIPENVATRFAGTIIRLGQNGTITNFYTGDVTTNANKNLQQPAVILVTHAHVLDTLSIYGNSNGSDKGSAFVAGKNWVANPSIVPTIVAAGTGYQVNDLITFPQPSKSPYFPTVVKVTGINGSGGVTSVSFTGGSIGAYALPPVLQQQIWTATNGFTGSIANGSVGQVFDTSNSTWYVTRGGSGTGAKFTISWYPDFLGGGAAYNGGLTLIGDTLIENISASSCGTSIDGTYGPQFGVMLWGLNYDIPGIIYTGGGYVGSYLNGVADVHGGTFNPVNAVIGMKVAKGGSLSFKLLVDTPSSMALVADSVSQLNVHDGSYSINVGGALTGTACVAIGSDTGLSNNTNKMSSCDIHMTMQNMGTVPAFYLDYITDGSVFDGIVSNTASTTSAVSHAVSTFAQFGSHNSNNFVLTGSIDGVSGNLFSGTVPNAGLRIWDAQVNAWALGSNVYNMQGSGAPTSGGSGTGLNKAGIGSLYTDFTNGDIYINTAASSSPSWAKVTHA